MIKRLRFFIYATTILIFSAFASPTQGVNAQAVGPSSSVTGAWNVSASGDAFKSGVMTLTQQGATVTGSAPAANGSHHQISGTFSNEVLKGTWRAANNESGWFTLFFAADGNGFNGEWGYHGRPPNGLVTGTRVAKKM